MPKPLLLAALALLLLPAPLAAQASGDTLRVEVAGRRLTGTALVVAPDSLLLQVERDRAPEQVTIPAACITRIETLAGRESRSSRALRSAALGVVAAAGLVLSIDRIGVGDLPAEPGKVGLRVMVPGVVAGGILGLMRGGERWAPVPAPVVRAEGDGAHPAACAALH